MSVAEITPTDPAFEIRSIEPAGDGWWFVEWAARPTAEPMCTRRRIVAWASLVDGDGTVTVRAMLAGDGPHLELAPDDRTLRQLQVTTAIRHGSEFSVCYCRDPKPTTNGLCQRCAGAMGSNDAHEHALEGIAQSVLRVKDAVYDLLGTVERQQPATVLVECGVTDERAALPPSSSPAPRQSWRPWGPPAPFEALRDAEQAIARAAETSSPDTLLEVAVDAAWRISEHVDTGALDHRATIRRLIAAAGDCDIATITEAIDRGLRARSRNRGRQRR